MLCKGDLAGKLVMDSYTTVIVEGSVTGSIAANSYVTVFVRESLSGAFKSTSYANLRVMGGISGKMDLFDGNNIYVAGYTRMAVVNGWTFRDRATVTLEGSDVGPGEHKGPKRVTVTVLEP